MILTIQIKEAFLELLRAALCEADADVSLFVKLTGKDWSRLYDLVRLQRVTSFTFPVIERLPDKVKPPRFLFLQWMANQTYLVSLAKERSELTKEWLTRLADAGFHPLVMKGWSFAQYYPDPLVRMSWDMDLYFPERFEEVLQVVKQWGLDSTEGGLHVSVDYKGMHVEMHPLLIYPESLGRVDETAVRTVLPGGLSFLSPVVTSNAILMLTHMARHTMISSSDFRHLSDYLRLLKVASKQLDTVCLRNRLKLMGLGHFSDALQQIGEKYLGLDAVFYCYPPSKKQDKLTDYFLGDLLKNGNGGDEMHIMEQKCSSSNNPFRRAVLKAKYYVYILNRLFRLRALWPLYTDLKTKELIIGWFKHRLPTMH